MKFRAFKNGKYIYSFTSAGDRLGWFFANCKEGCKIEQWSGLVDSKGQNIYEGDILSCPWHFDTRHRSKGFVVFQNGAFCLARKIETDPILIPYGKYDTYGFNDTPTRRDQWEYATVIGNINQDKYEQG